MYLGGNLRWTGAPELWYYGLSKEKTGNLHCIHARKFSCDVSVAHLNTQTGREVLSGLCRDGGGETMTCSSPRGSIMPKIMLEK